MVGPTFRSQIRSLRVSDCFENMQLNKPTEHEASQATEIPLEPPFVLHAGYVDLI